MNPTVYSRSMADPYRDITLLYREYADDPDCTPAVIAVYIYGITRPSITSDGSPWVWSNKDCEKRCKVSTGLRQKAFRWLQKAGLLEIIRQNASDGTFQTVYVWRSGSKNDPKTPSTPNNDPDLQVLGPANSPETDSPCTVPPCTVPPCTVKPSVLVNRNIVHRNIVHREEYIDKEYKEEGAEDKATQSFPDLPDGKGMIDYISSLKEPPEDMRATYKSMNWKRFAQTLRVLLREECAVPPDGPECVRWSIIANTWHRRFRDIPCWAGMLLWDNFVKSNRPDRSIAAAYDRELTALAEAWRASHA